VDSSEELEIIGTPAPVATEGDKVLTSAKSMQRSPTPFFGESISIYDIEAAPEFEFLASRYSAFDS
jgi:hypothetical protein